MKYLLLIVLTTFCIAGYTQYDFLDNLSDMESSDSLSSIYNLDVSLNGKVLVCSDTITKNGWVDDKARAFVTIGRFTLNRLLSDHYSAKILSTEEGFETRWKYKLKVEFNSMFEGIGYIYISKYGGIIVYQFPKYKNYYFTTIIFNDEINDYTAFLTR